MLLDIFYITTITETHMGCGEGVGLIDNPIIRHRRNRFPYLPSSSIKGVLKDKYRQSGEFSEADINVVFGPDNADHAAGLSILDAELLFFPVRSIAGIFAWTTCPSALLEFSYRLQKLNKSIPNLKELLGKIATVEKMKGLITQNVADSRPRLQYDGKTVLLEEFAISTEYSAEFQKFVEEMAKIWEHSEIRQEFLEKSILIADEIFTYFVTQCTTVSPNIRINPETGTTKIGSLRYTEYLPEFCVFHSSFIYQPIMGKSSYHISAKFLRKQVDVFEAKDKASGYSENDFKEIVNQLSLSSDNGKKELNLISFSEGWLKELSKIAGRRQWVVLDDKKKPSYLIIEVLKEKFSGIRIIYLKSEKILSMPENSIIKILNEIPPHKNSWKVYIDEDGKSHELYLLIENIYGTKIEIEVYPSKLFLPSTIQIGGDETIGKGWVFLSLSHYSL